MRVTEPASHDAAWTWATCDHGQSCRHGRSARTGQSLDDTDLPPLFDFVDVTVDGRDRARLDAVNLQVHGGRVTAVLGPSGAGKSTLLRLCNRLEAPDTGLLRFRGVDVAGIPPRDLRREVGMVFQRPVLFPGTVLTNLLAARPDADDRAVAAAMEAAELPADLLHRSVDELSGGEAQRACIARALMLAPAVLLADEPTSSLDPQAGRQVEATAANLVRSGCSLLWVTHDHEQARRIADDVVVLEQGRVRAVGPASDVLRSHPAAHQQGGD